MDILLVTMKDFSYVLVQHPTYSAIGGFILFCGLLRFYCKLTMGFYEDEQDMTGRTVLITGASEGIGKFTALHLARRNARVLLACRNLEKAGKVANEIKKSTGNQSVHVYHLELSSFKSVKNCAQDILRNEKELHVLINNAGISGVEGKWSDDGCELTMQTNHFGHFLLTLLLLELLKRSTPSRIINVSSAAHSFSSLDLDDMANKKGKGPITVYANSKLANVLFTRELAERLKGTGVTVNALHPGCVNTEIFRGKRDLASLSSKFLFFVVGKTPEEGAQTTIRLAVDPSLERATGKYFVDCKEADVSKKAKDRSLAERLFQLSELIVGTSFSQT